MWAESASANARFSSVPPSAGNEGKKAVGSSNKNTAALISRFPGLSAAACLLRTRLFAVVALIVLVVILIMALVIVILIIAGLPSIFSFVLVLFDRKFPRSAASVFPLEFKAEWSVKGKESLDFGDYFIV
ncbi:hypothetical protein [Geobacillus sp. TFV-3]|uniref:hypothetical protein n=1 Tax=Geobacillus sp. TFV-3 TaxID=1897059 RepID=UPI001916D86F|nr:hypothetical protein [Geobacillus sp. TFV-3]